MIQSRWIICGHNGECHWIVNLSLYFSFERVIQDAAEIQHNFPSAVITVVEIRR